MAFVRKIKKGNSVYLARVENYRQDGKVKQRVLEYLGKEVNSLAVRTRPKINDFDVTKVSQFIDIAAISAIANKLELNDLLGKDAKQLLAIIFSHLLERSSINKMPEWFEKTEILDILKVKKIASSDLYEALHNLSNMNFSIIESSIVKILKPYDESDKVAVLDITDTYFNGSNADWKARRGKDGKFDKLVQIALAVSFKHGFPITHKTYEGNISGFKIFEDMINQLATLGYSSVIVDRGMGSKNNIKNILDYDFKTIMGHKTTRTIEKEFLSKIQRDKIFTKKCMVELKETKVYIQGFDYMNGRLIAVYNPNIEIAQKEKQIENDKPINKYAGYSLIYSNTGLADIDVVKMYFEKDIVERSFKKIKGELDLHPLRASKIEHIKAHIRICYLSYAIYSLIEYFVKPLNLSAKNAIKQLEGGYKVFLKIKDSDKTIEKIVTLKKVQENILHSLGVVYKIN
jgi:transposase